MIKNKRSMPETLKHYFNSQSYSSFTRQLNFYGFRRVRTSRHIKYTHSIFRKGNYESFSKITKNKKNDKPTNIHISFEDSVCSVDIDSLEAEEYILVKYNKEIEELRCENINLEKVILNESQKFIKTKEIFEKVYDYLINCEDNSILCLLKNKLMKFNNDLVDSYKLLEEVEYLIGKLNLENKEGLFCLDNSKTFTEQDKSKINSTRTNTKQDSIFKTQNKLVHYRFNETSLDSLELKSLHCFFEKKISN